MPQLNTTSWFFVISIATLSLFCIFQLNLVGIEMIYIYPPEEVLKLPEIPFPWEKKWTKIYLPLSSVLTS
uniref:ATP synthase complex subunit 8 n=1 Tax=Thylacinus cynocephalus TaxID=9275 RepID=B8YB93_THYCY|nr:ATP synthase F0 subunit 8 [Thylacinus cynocephalus]ACK57326.1 ATP synthase F0 subunit 8 [Thylacinus cynocephalus]ACK57339.1 ATP synthase F0 subunit 8 [Thylacinus cynocephalus]ATD52296.1 ATP synthase F0 subunit 8 [Thylacinus cynocephalus]ATD52322.1 ATP synthase F0 subunit 8 [Thylacinus cynocephalus]ATD52348.1 ATP synthase F0 subunit 8 [Thylacinus cynocephalus]